jgi:hypothetical protein
VAVVEPLWPDRLFNWYHGPIFGKSLRPMQSSNNGLHIRRQGTLDDISLHVSIRRDALAFTTQVYVNDRQLHSEAEKLTHALERVFDPPEPQDVVLAFGLKAPRSPSFELAIQIDKLGHVRMDVSMVARFMDTAPPLKSDTCTIHLISDLASLDSFAAQLSGLSNGENPTAQFSAE